MKPARLLVAITTLIASTSPGAATVAPCRFIVELRLPPPWQPLQVLFAIERPLIPPERANNEVLKQHNRITSQTLVSNEEVRARGLPKLQLWQRVV